MKLLNKHLFFKILVTGIDDDDGSSESKIQGKNEREYVPIFLHSRSNMHLEVRENVLAGKINAKILQVNLTKAKRLKPGYNR